MEERLRIAKQAILQAGAYLKERFHSLHSVTLKEDQTELLGEDISSEDILLSTLHTHFPSDSFLTEERDTKLTSDLVWVFDPICGSYSYLRGVETWSLSIALIRGDEYIIGVVYQPLLDNLFYSLKGAGAFRSNVALRPSSVSEISKAFVSVEHGVFDSKDIDMSKLIRNIKRIRVGHGSGGELAYVAAGYLDAVIKTGQTLTHFAGGRAIVEEAGGTFMDFTGQRAPTFLDKHNKVDYIACNPFLKDVLLQYIRL